MVRLLYSLLLWLASPLIALRLLWRSRRQPEYLGHLNERLGLWRGRNDGRWIWVHAVSVGETRAAQPLIAGLQARWPTHRILLTCMTPTGRAAGREVYGEGVHQVYLPYDFPGATRRFLRHFQPAFGVLMETEIWPNLLAAAARQRVPVVLANARLSERSARGYQRFAALTGQAWASLSGIAAQTAEDARRLVSLSAAPCHIAGNLKFDVTPPPEKLALGQHWREQVVPRPVWLAASSREGEEELILAAWQKARKAGRLLVIVPRHPQRFAEVASLLRRENIPFGRRSDGLPQPEHEVWLGDSMGEMVAYYGLADLAFIGGSLLPLGGQNLIEAAACGCPVLVGPHTFNFLQATQDALAAGAAQRIADAAALGEAVARLLDNPQELAAMRQSAEVFAAAHRGATARTLQFIEEICPVA